MYKPLIAAALLTAACGTSTPQTAQQPTSPLPSGQPQAPLDELVTGNNGFAIELYKTLAKDAKDGRAKFARLAEGGEILMDYQETFFAYGFGTCKDRFGTHWMIMIAKEEE